MIAYIVLAEICKIIGVPTWVVKLCWVGFVLQLLDMVADIVKWIRKQTNADIVIRKSPLPKSENGRTH